MNKKAIVVYLDKSHRIQLEFSWLYKTWLLHSLDKEYDLVVYHHPEAKYAAESFRGIKTYEMPYIRMAEEYKFLNSHYFCQEPWCQPLREYDYILKTDCDVFLTHNLKNYTPSKLLIGEGGYYNGWEEKKFNFMRQKFKQFYGAKANFNFLIRSGASYFGNTRSVIALVQGQIAATEEIIKYFDRKGISSHDDDPDTGFHRGISSMIGGELALNKMFSNQHVIMYALDSHCWETTEIGSDVLHIHAWHSGQKFSKHSFIRGEYEDWIVDDEERYSNAANYCQWIARNSLNHILLFRDGPEISDRHYNILEGKGERRQIFLNDGNVEIVVPEHEYAKTYCDRHKHEAVFRRINHYLFKKNIISGNVIDLGAWIGDNTIPWAKNFPKSKFYAIEPSRYNCDFIEELALINDTSNVKTICSAISKDNEVIRTKAIYGDNLYHCTLTDEEGEGGTKLQAASLDYLYSIGSIDNIGYMHLDVEGMEYQVILGAENIIKEFTPVITFEQHIEKENYQIICEHLDEKGYDVYMINEQLLGCYPDCRNFLALPKESFETDELICEIEASLGIQNLFTKM